MSPGMYASRMSEALPRSSLPRVRAGVLVLVAGLLVVGVVPSCVPDGRACAPSDFQYCSCPSAQRGYQQCLDDGSRYGACDCSGTIPPGAGILVEAGPAPEASAPEGGLLGFLEPCSDDVECATKKCFPFNAYGPHCSQPCRKDADCPPPSPGCSNNLVCKLR